MLAYPGASDEERFWALRYRLEERGIVWSRAMQLLKLFEGESFAPVVAALDKTLRARTPTSYLGKIVAGRRALLKAEAEEDEPPGGSEADDDEPRFVREFRADGYDVERDGPKRWRIAGAIYDETGDQAGF